MLETREETGQVQVLHLGGDSKFNLSPQRGRDSRGLSSSPCVNLGGSLTFVPSDTAASQRDSCFLNKWSQLIPFKSKCPRQSMPPLSDAAVAVGDQ